LGRVAPHLALAPSPSRAGLLAHLKEVARMSVDIPTIAFYVIAIVLVGSSLAVVLLRNIVRAALSLILVFGAAAGVYVLLNAEFIAIVQVLIYAGAITVLILFAIMLTQHSMSQRSNPFSGQWWLAGLICVLLGAGIIYAVGSSTMLAGSASSTLPLAGVGPSTGTVVRLGQLLYSPFTYSYVLPFEIASIVLLVAIIGAIMIGRAEEE
jgi:NADH:ubiquinone oxidoreductase subunit 6 (subunit J)